MNKSKKFLIAIFVFLLLPSMVNGATLYLDPSEGLHGPGDSFTTEVKIETDKFCINTVDIGLKFPSDYLRVVDFITGDSILNIWLDKPDSGSINKINSEGTIHFAGGIPGGYCGHIPGDPGKSNILAKIVWQIPGMIVSGEKRDILEINFSNQSRVLLNDGLGTDDKIVSRGARFKFSPRSTGVKEDWRKQIKEDNIPPEPFTVELLSNPGVFNGQYYIIFSTVDKQTGVDHYEVLEIRPGEKIGVEMKRGFVDSLLSKKRPVPNWKRAKMPYPLEDQSLQSIIRVKAVDKAGNERLVEYIPPLSMRQPIPQNNFRMIIFVVLLMVGGVVVLAAAWVVVRLVGRRKRNS